MNTETDALEHALELLAEARDVLARCDLPEYVRRTGLPHLEGNDAGWLGGPYLVDQLRAALAATLGEQAAFYDVGGTEAPNCRDCGHGADQHADTADAFCKMCDGCRGLNIPVDAA